MNKMDQSFSDSDVSLSPSQLLERLQMLRQLQLLQRGKLHKQRLQYQETSENYETSSCITEMISHFSNSNNSTSYNTFRSLLQSPQITETPRPTTSDLSQKVNANDLIDGVSALNLSQESEFIENSPASTNRAPSKNEDVISKSSEVKCIRNQITLDDMPIISPKKDFEALIIEKLQKELNVKVKSPKKSVFNAKKQFLKRGEGMTRFGVKKNDLVIQNTNSLPWRKKNGNRPLSKLSLPQESAKSMDKLDVDLSIPKLTFKKQLANKPKEIKLFDEQPESNKNSKILTELEPEHFENQMPNTIMKMPTGKHPTLATKGKTWATVLSKEQSEFLTKLKQSDYYKNFASPAKSTVSDVRCDVNGEWRQQKETAEQNLFELLENKVSHDSFNIENSFFNHFLKRSNLECSGESTPLVFQKCLANNPNLMHILPELRPKNPCNETESAYTDCCSDTCSSVSSCCSCKTIEPATPQECKKIPPKSKKEVQIEINAKKYETDTDKDAEAMKANMAEMNAKLITTSELLKERLRELEDEIETFRKENVNLNKLREEVDAERQKFYEEKNIFEQKFNEEKILSEYYIAEEKEKLNKQKQMYERYVREMRGRLNKKEKDEVVSLKQDISNLKEEIRTKDAKTTSTIARLRNQLKIMEKEKVDLQQEVEKTKKENRRIQHSNDITRRMTNMKYLEQINKKLTNMNKEPQSEVEISSNTKYKAFEIERQSRSRKIQTNQNTVRPRAKSVPNLKVTSRYAKYFSQKDASSELGKNYTTNIETDYGSDNEIAYLENESGNEMNSSDPENDNNLEKVYMETFRSNSPKRCLKDGSENLTEFMDTNGFFIQKSHSKSSSSNTKVSLNRSKSPVAQIPLIRRSDASDSNSRRSQSPVSILSHRSSQGSFGSNDSKLGPKPQSPSFLSNHSSLRSGTVIPNDAYRNKLESISPEPSHSKTSLTKTSLTPTELRKSDGSRELRYPNGNVKYITADGKYTKFVYYNGDVKENFLSDGRIKYYYAETKTYHTTHPDGLEVLEFPDGQVEKRYKDGSSEVRLPNGSVRYHDPKNEHVREEWRFPDGAALTVSASGEQRIAFSNGQIEVHAKDHKRREFPDGTVKLVYNDGTSETRYASGRVRIKDKHGNLIMDSATG